MGWEGVDGSMEGVGREANMSIGCRGGEVDCLVWECAGWGGGTKNSLVSVGEGAKTAQPWGYR